MGFASGSISFRRYAVIGNSPDAIDQALLDRLSQHALRESEIGVRNEEEYGWSGGRHVFDGTFSFTNAIDPSVRQLFYLLQVPGSDPPLASRIISYLQHDLLQALAPLCLLALAAIVLHLRARPLSSASGWLWFMLLAIADSGWMRARLGGNINTLMPAYTFLCLAPAIVLSKLGTSSHINKTTRAVMQSLVYMLVIAQCVLCRYNPLTRIPDVAMQQMPVGAVEMVG